MHKKIIAGLALLTLSAQVFFPYSISFQNGIFSFEKQETYANPGGISSGLQVWVKADENGGVTTDGTTVTNLSNHAGTNFISSGTENVTYEDDSSSLMNYNPTLNFPGLGYYQASDSFGFNGLGAETFAVVKSFGTSPSFGSYAILGPDAGAMTNSFEFTVEDASDSLRFKRYGEAFDIANRVIPTTSSSILSASRDSVTGQGVTGLNGLETTGSTNISNFAASPGYYFGASHNFGIFKGQMPEFIAYNRSLTSSETSQVNSYLALKYGITLDSSAGDYLDSTGSSVYNIDAYSVEITGIGYDSSSTLDQRVSQSIDDTDALIIATDADFTSINTGTGRIQLIDGQYVVTGHNGSTKNSFTSTFDGDLNMRSDRVWKLENTGNVSSVFMAIPLGQLSNIPSGGQPSLIVSSDTTFDYSDDVYPLIYDRANGLYYVEIINPTDGSFISIAPVPVASASAYYRTSSSTGTNGVSVYSNYADFIGGINGTYYPFSHLWAFGDSFFVDGVYFYRTNITQTQVTRYPSIEDLGANTNGVTYNFSVDWADSDEFFSSATEYYRTNSSTGTPSLTSYPSFADLIANTNSTTSNTFNSTYAFDDQFFHDGTYFMRTGTSGGNHVNIARYASLTDLENGVLVGGSIDAFGPYSTDDDIFAQAVTAEITASTGSLSIDENAGIGSFTVVLNSRPASNVVIDISSSDLAEATVSPASLTFTPSNWNISQSVVVTGVDDFDYSGDDTATITIGVNAVTSNDAFDTVVDTTVDITLINEDIPNIKINEIEYDSIQTGTDAAYEWIELKNFENQAIDISGWTLGDDDGGGAYTFGSGTIISSGAIFLIVNNTAGFQTNYSSVTPDIDTGNIWSLSNTGEPLTLINTSGATIDFMAYEGGDVAWNTLIANPGEALCRKDTADTNTVADWQVCTAPTPGSENNLNEVPTDITLSGSGALDENTATGSLIGDFSTTDLDVTDIHSYTFATGTGDTDNTLFTLSGSSLFSLFSPDFETKNSYSVRIETNDGNGGTFQKEFSISINDLDEITPVITLNGSGSISQEALLPYTDAGAIWTDNVDGSGALIASGNVITNILGTYPLYYDYTDSSGNIALQVIRNVTITSPTCNPGRELFTGTGGVVSCQACQEGYYNASAGGTCIPADAGYYVPNLESNIQLACPSGTFTDTTGNNICTTCPSGYTSGTGATSCNDVEIPVITLNGSGSLDIEYGTAYTDAGAIWTDNAIGNNSGSLVASGSVDTNILGTYTLTYNYTDVAGNVATQVSRTVNVIDTTLPIITLIGSGSIDVELGSLYTDNGATASDTYDGDITGNIVSTGSVNTSQTGSYLIAFDVTDSNGNTAVQVTRTVNVIDTIVPSGILDDDIDIGPVQSDRFAITPDDFAGIQVVYFGNSTDASCDINDNYTIPIVGTGSVYVETSDESLNGEYACAKIIDTNGNISYIVSSNPYNIDITAPVISSYNAPNIIRELNTSVDLLDGIVATDNIDDDIALTSNIQSSGSIDTTTEGVYTLIYNVSDIAGNPATPFTRTISIYSTTLDSDGDGVPNLYEAVDQTDMNDSTDYLDTDNDGVSDYEERKGFNNGDGDGDGISDNMQQNVSGAKNPVTGQTSTLKTSGSCTFITENAFVAESSLVVQDPTAEYPVGLVDFQVQCANPGDSSDVTIYYTQLYDTSNWRYKKYDGGGNVYADITSLVTYGTAIVGGTPVTTVSFTITDGDPQTDEDGVADGVINDPSGPAVTVTGGGVGIGGSRVYSCRDPKATNYRTFGFSDQNLCKYHNEEVENLDEKPTEDFTNREQEIQNPVEPENAQEDSEDIDSETFDISKQTETEKELSYTLGISYNSCSVVNSLKDTSYVYTNSGVFLDERDSEYMSKILKFKSLGIIDGYKDATFKPKNEITRAEFLKIVLASHCIVYREQDISILEFIDVDTFSWQARVIAKAQEIGIINGDIDKEGNKVFRPNDTISKVEAIKIAMRMSMIESKDPVALEYIDLGADWYIPYVKTGQALGLFSPEEDNFEFKPELGVTREYMINLIDSLIQFY